MNFAHLLALLRTLPRIGATNLVRFAAYRVLQRAGFYRWRLPVGQTYAGPFWSLSGEPSRPPGLNEENAFAVIAHADRVLAGHLSYFSSQERPIGFPPSWLCEPGEEEPWRLTHWSSGSEFGSTGRDIKVVWEPSRFDALPILAAAAIVDPSARRNEALNAWIESWVQANPANAGPNWRCAQETALRLLNTLLADLLLRDAGVARATPALERFVAEHCTRIEPTMLYAIAQDNNHATSEAVGLYVAGLWLSKYGSDLQRRSAAARWRARGRQLLERGVARLVLDDGTFAQYSVNYHRLFLDTVALALVFQRRFEDAPFDAETLERLGRAAHWLRCFVDPANGDAPNLGANDGARLLHISGTGYRDFRPHVQLSFALLHAQRVFPRGTADALLHWLRIEPPARDAPPLRSELFGDGGYAMLAATGVRAYVRLPIMRFRHGHADFLHVDLWFDGVDLARDGGTYSYNATEDWSRYFPGTESHNTVQFDGRDQMPRLSRFLFGDWPRPELLAFDGAVPELTCAYADRFGARHERTVRLGAGAVEIVDRIDRFRRAVARLRLCPAAWRLAGTSVEGGPARIRIDCSDAQAMLRLKRGFESREYGSMSELAVLEVETARAPCEIRWLIEKN